MYLQNQASLIVAGPGTGKTASLTLRILKLVLVDALGREYSRDDVHKKGGGGVAVSVLGWGFRILDSLKMTSLRQRRRHSSMQ